MNAMLISSDLPQNLWGGSYHFCKSYPLIKYHTREMLSHLMSYGKVENLPANILKCGGV